MANDSDTVDMEVSLFHAMRGHKPVGVNRHFQMLLIHEKLNNCFNRKISAKQIWSHLMTMYDLQALNESEILPFPNAEKEFELPEQEYGGLQSKDFPRIATSVSAAKSVEENKTEATKPTKSEKCENLKIENKHTSGVLHANTPENSPKRKRTRHSQSSHTSPATPDVPTKRRR